jgi:hypothetical protein
LSGKHSGVSERNVLERIRLFYVGDQLLGREKLCELE